MTLNWKALYYTKNYLYNARCWATLSNDWKGIFFFISKLKNSHGSLMRAVQFFRVIYENPEVK